jgi:hypothetical protein
MLFLLFFVSMLLFASADSQAEETYSPGEQKILEEIRSIRKAIEALDRRLAAIEKKLEESEDAPTTPPPFFPGAFRKADSRNFKSIVLPENPTREQSRQYVQKIKEASGGQNIYSSSDSQIALLMKVPRKHLDVLLDAVEGRFPGMTNYHVLEALKQMVTEEDLPRVREALSVQREIVALIKAKGWEKDVEDVLIRELDSGDAYLPTDWIAAVASLNNPLTYPKLLHYLLHGMNPHMTLKAIESIPDFPQAEFEEAVGKIWEKKKSGEGEMPYGPHLVYEKVAVAKAAAKIGHVDALEYCIRRLIEKKKSTFDHDQDLRPSVLRLVPVRLSNKELLRWCRENSRSLVFNRETGKYEVEKEKEGDEGF